MYCIYLFVFQSDQKCFVKYWKTSSTNNAINKITFINCSDANNLQNFVTNINLNNFNKSFYYKLENYINLNNSVLYPNAQFKFKNAKTIFDKVNNYYSLIMYIKKKCN